MLIKQFPNLDIKELNTGNIFINYLQYRTLLKKLPTFLSKLNSDVWFILSCGPSLGLFDNDPEFYELLKKYPVLSVKAAGNLFRDVTNIQVFNEVRYDPSFSTIGNYRFSVSKFVLGSNTHLHFPIKIKGYSLEKSLYKTNQYEKNTLEKKFLRPWGVGIFYEIALFFPILFGAKKIITCGVDMNYKDKYHFYDQGKLQDASFYKVNEEEFFFTKGTSYYIMYWLKEKGIKLANFSPLSELPFPKYNSVSDLSEFINN